MESKGSAFLLHSALVNDHRGQSTQVGHTRDKDHQCQILSLKPTHEARELGDYLSTLPLLNKAVEAREVQEIVRGSLARDNTCLEEAKVLPPWLVLVGLECPGKGIVARDEPILPASWKISDLCAQPSGGPL